MSSVGKTYYSQNYGNTFSVSGDSIYIDGPKPPVPVSVMISEGSGSVDATIIFDRKIDKDTVNLGTWTAILHYLNGGSNTNGTHEGVSFPIESDPYTVTAQFQISKDGDLGGDFITYNPDGVNEILGVNGVGTGSWSIRENNNYPNPKTAFINIDGATIEMIIEFSNELDPIPTFVANRTLKYNNYLYSTLGVDYPSENQWRVIWNKESFSIGNEFTYIKLGDPTLQGVNGVEVRDFNFYLDGTSNGVIINE